MESKSYKVSIPEEFQRQGDSIQNWVKRVLSRLFVQGYLTKDEIERLHDLEYSKQTFGITFSLLCDNLDEVNDAAGHPRYWKNWKLCNKYFVCSQWWLQRQNEYELNINKWIAKLILNSNIK